jgi:ammonia channel protein AmtB
MHQAAALGCAAYSFVLSYIIFRVMSLFMDLHVPHEKVCACMYI